LCCFDCDDDDDLLPPSFRYKRDSKTDNNDPHTANRAPTYKSEVVPAKYPPSAGPIVAPIVYAVVIRASAAALLVVAAAASASAVVSSLLPPLHC
jgi:hypothetical protein